MKTKANQNGKSGKAPNPALTSLVEEKLKGKVLFAEKIETTKDFLNKVKISAL